MLLSEAIKRTQKCVLATRFIGYDSLETSDSIFTAYSMQGITEFPVSSNSVAILRDFYPKLTVMGNEYLSFGSQVAWQYDSILTKKFLRRNNKEEPINFSGNFKAYNAYEWQDIIEKRFDPAHIKDRIVLIGDLDQKPINRLGILGELIFAFLMCTIHVRLLFWIRKRISNWYDSVAVALIIFMLALAAVIRIEMFVVLSIKAYLSLTLTSLALSGIAISIYENFETWWNSMPDGKLNPLYYWLTAVMLIIMCASVAVRPESDRQSFGLADICFLGILTFNFSMFFVYRKRRLAGYKNFMRLVLIQLAIGVPLASLYVALN